MITNMKATVDIPIKYPVIRDPHILDGTPVIKGSRIPASLVFELLQRGYSLELLKTEYPSLSMRKLNAFLLLMSQSFNVSSPQTI